MTLNMSSHLAGCLVCSDIKRVNRVGGPSFPLACQELTFKGLEKATTRPISTEPHEHVCVRVTARQTLGFSFSLWALGLSPKATPLPSVAS